MRRQLWLQIYRCPPEAWSDDWEAAECAALRRLFGVTDRLERAPAVASDADLVWQNAPDASGNRSWHVHMWAPELRYHRRG